MYPATRTLLMSASRVIRSELVIPRAQLKSQNYWRAGLYLKWTTPTTSHHNSLFRVWNFLFLHLQLQSANNAPEGKTNQTYHKNREEETTCLPNSWINDFHSLYWGWIRLRFHDESASRNRAGIAKQSSSHIPLFGKHNNNGGASHNYGVEEINQAFRGGARSYDGKLGIATVL